VTELKSSPQHGRWWDITKPEKRFAGVLQLDDDNSGKLVIRGKESDLPLFDRPPNPSTILGRLTSEPMHDISVLGAHHKRGPTSTYPPNPERETEVAFSASCILFGVHVDTVEKPFINRMRFSLTGLEEWCNTTGFSGKHEIPQHQSSLLEDERELDSVQVFFRSSATDYFDIGGGKRLRFLSLYRGPDNFDREKKVTLTERNRIEIIFPERVSINQAVDEIRIWQTFISFGLRIPIFLDDILLRKDEGDVYKRMSLFVPERKWEVPKRPRHHRGILFNQSKLGDKIGERLKEWRDKQDIIDVSVLLFRGACYLQDVYIHTNVPTYLQALEVFHRELYDDDEFPNANAKKSAVLAFRAAIPKSLDRALQDEICQRLSHIGSATYMERLQLLFRRYPKCLGPLFPRGDEDLKPLRNARNFLTHYGEQGELDKEFMSSREVYVLGEKARIFLEVCLLGAMGMTDDEILKLLEEFEPLSGPAHRD
jgi:hypothetical protein